MTSARRKSFISIIIATIIFIFGITAGMSFAYFSDTKTATSTLSFGKLKIALSDTVGSSTQETITLTPTASGGNNLLAPNDTITLTGSVGLEENSIPAYIRVKVELYETSSTSSTTETKVSAPAFVSGFLSQMSTIKDGDKQWFVKDNYLYYGNAMVVGEPFTYSASNTNTDTTKNPTNIISITDEMLPELLQGKSVKVKLIYQAIQVSGALASGTTISSGTYASENATAISQSALWDSIFVEMYNPELNVMYNGKYYSGYVRGNLNKTVGTHSSYSAYTNSLTTSTGVKSPFEFFQEDATGDYIAFGYYPQTIASSSNSIDKTKTITFNGQQYYKDSDGYLYVKKALSSTRSGYSYSDGTMVSVGDCYFKLEPIIWRILNASTGLLYSVSGLTAMCFYEDYRNNRSVTINGVTTSGIKPNNYEYSYVRAYLNGLTTYGPSGTANGTSSQYDYNGKGLYQTAFSDNQKRVIGEKVTVENNLDSTEESSNGNTCEDTQDWIFLLSKKEINTTYTSAKEIKFPTDYAIACGADKKSDSSTAYGGYYWLRSPKSGNPGYAWDVKDNGGLSYSSVNCWNYGVVPALYLKMS